MADIPGGAAIEDDPESIVYNTLMFLYFGVGVYCLVSLGFLKDTSPYGRYVGDKNVPWIYRCLPDVPARPAWVFMECPSSIVFAILFGMPYWLQGEVNDFFYVPLYLFLLWELHYFQRSFIWPICVLKNPGKMNVVVCTFGFLLNSINSYLCVTFITRKATYPLSYFYDPRLIIGSLVFFLGYYINRRADRMLSQLREKKTSVSDEKDPDVIVAPNGRVYRIPRGFLYDYISCPNYLGEVLIWTGWAIASWSPAGCVFAVFTSFNLFPRALQNHQWYKEKFPNYPKNRKAMIPFIA